MLKKTKTSNSHSPPLYTINLPLVNPMEYINATIDRIHYLVEQSAYLRDNGFGREAELLIEEAEEHAQELRQLQAN